MKKAVLFFEKRMDRIFRKLALQGAEWTDEDYHDFRVELKKLRALIGFLHRKGRGAQVQAFPDPLLNIFKQAGKVRELYIDLDILPQYLEPEVWHSIKQELVFVLEQQKQVFARKHAQFVFPGQEPFRAIVILQIQQLKKKDVVKFLQHQEVKLQKALSDLQRKDLHKLRIRLKRYRYLAQAMAYSSPWIKKLDKHPLIEWLGDWNDLDVLIQRLKQYAREVYPDKKPEWLAAITLLQKAQLDLQNRILASIPAVLS